MSTRSAVGTIDENGTFRGRYVHSDGYPTWQGPALTRILAQLDGDLPQMLRVLTEDFYGWSQLDGIEAEDYDSRLGGRGVRVPRFGLAYTTVQGQSSPEEWYVFGEPTVPLAQRFAMDCDIEWAYGFTSDDPATAQLRVYANIEDTMWEVARVAVREMHRTDWERMQSAQLAELVSLVQELDGSVA